MSVGKYTWLASRIAGVGLLMIVTSPLGSPELVITAFRMAMSPYCRAVGSVTDGAYPILHSGRLADACNMLDLNPSTCASESRKRKASAARSARQATPLWKPR
ncbi:hypothetical protein B0T25DRAFT_356769 [Lasiosphaeria hispida]|uniref:Uncharacterized protein n=1 Tax=Lasiosphaeria hispida TaxID=260671 RepID=A0AAJ0H7W1_9PEZI|nr:hypothetical protein B0T25DRAFT_356769 [Lasiosphaeria hispida]